MGIKKFIQRTARKYGYDINRRNIQSQNEKPHYGLDSTNEYCEIYN